MKKISMFLLLSFMILTVNAQIPKNLGDFTLGSSLNSVEKTLASMGLEKTEIGMMDRGKYAIDYMYEDPVKKIDVAFPAADPLSYLEAEWRRAELYFYNGNLYKIELVEGYWGEMFEDAQAVKTCKGMYNDVEKKLNSLYAKFKNKKESNTEGEVINAKYNSGNISLNIQMMNFEYEGVEVRVILKDNATEKKAEDI